VLHNFEHLLLMLINLPMCDQLHINKYNAWFDRVQFFSTLSVITRLYKNSENSSSKAHIKYVPNVNEESS